LTSKCGWRRVFEPDREEEVTGCRKNYVMRNFMIVVHAGDIVDLINDDRRSQ
jgi:hypothetical protein